MLSNKWTFSLTCFIALFVLAFATPYALADGSDIGDGKTFHDLGVTIGAAESMIDVSSKDGLQISSGRSRMSRSLDLSGDGVSEHVFQSAGVDSATDLTDDVYTVSDLKADTPTAAVAGISGNPTAAGGTIESLYANPSVLDFITISVNFSHPVNLHNPGADLQDLEEAKADTAREPKDSGGDFGTDDIFVAAFDMDGRQLGVLPLSDSVARIRADFIDATSPGRNFLVRIHQSHLLNAYNNAFEIYRLVFFIPRAQADNPAKNKDATVTRGIRRADLSHAIAHFGPGAHQHVNKPSDPAGGFEIQLVDADQGDPQYAKLTGLSSAMDVAVDGADADTTADGTADQGSGTPGVVSIMRTASRTGFIETGDFEVRIILTEEPMGGLTTTMIDVENGMAKSVSPGVKYKGGHQALTAVAVPADTVVVPARSKRESRITPEMIHYHIPVVDPSASPLVPAVLGGASPTAFADTAGIARVPVGATADNGTVAHFPEATGRDNTYYSYIAMISPNPNLPPGSSVTVSVAAFDDQVWPLGNRYVPLSAEQRNATRLTGWAKVVRDARVMNESLTVQVSTSADAGITAAATAYAARQAIYDANPLLKSFGNPKLVIPPGGYLVLAAGKTDSDPVSGVVNPNTKTKDKKTPAQKLYNVIYDFKLPVVGNDLSSFFRNGNSFSLVYQDITAATGSGHGDSKGATGDDATGYTAASTNAHAAGAVIINEIMWGQDAGSINSQYIELHNPGTAAIGLDNKEWAFAIGTPPAGFTVLDTVSNNPASGYWQVPGKNGVTTASGIHPVPTDLVSMSRMTDATDGTAAASWAMSILPSANILGQRIGTPGAPNTYDTSAQKKAQADADAQAEADRKAEADKAAASKAPVATASDLDITEIMVASSSGRLPQWIEITNTSVGAVSLEGWMVGIDNDSADADVVASSLSIKLDAVTSLDAGQSVLVVSKSSNRNSGVAARSKGDNNAGALDSNRIVDASSQIKPASNTYSMLSEMSFRISLEPPLPLAGGVTVRGDVVGNLGGGWELPMSETGRSSIIRRQMSKTTEIMGTDAAGWVLASGTGLSGAYVGTYYGDKDDVGTPGYDAGGALPVELSKFGAKRDPLTGQVVITWETQSELNNAGFFIKRSQQKNSKFVAVNPTMIPGAGTTSEKQSYTYTDTTAQPNIVYYYQIEDVSLDGQRQTLTRSHRLKGHVGAAGKLTTLWGQLKDQE